MRKKSLGHQTSGVGDSVVLPVQSTQLDVEQLERDLLLRDQSYNSIQHIGDGHVLEVKDLGLHYRYRTGIGSPGYGEGSCGVGSSISSRGSPNVRTVLRLIPVCDDINCNAGTRVRPGRSVSCHHQHLNRDNNASRAPGRRKGRRPSRKAVKVKQLGPQKVTQVIKIPADSIIKITSKSGLDQRSKQVSRSKSQTANSRASPTPSVAPSRKDSQSGSSRYRITPSLTGSSSKDTHITRYSRASSGRSYMRMGRRATSAASEGVHGSSGSKGSVLAAGSSSTARLGSKRGRLPSSGQVESRPSRGRYNSVSSLFERAMPTRMSLRRGARKLSRASINRRRRRSSKGSSSGRVSKSSRRSKSKRGRPRKGSSSRSVIIDTTGSRHALSSEVKTPGLMDRVSSLWRSYSVSRAASPTATAATTKVHDDTASNRSSSSWVARLLPLPRDKVALKRARRAKEEAEAIDARRRREEERRSKRLQKKGGDWTICRIM